MDICQLLSGRRQRPDLLEWQVRLGTLLPDDGNVLDVEVFQVVGDAVFVDRHAPRAHRIFGIGAHSAGQVLAPKLGVLVFKVEEMRRQMRHDVVVMHESLHLSQVCGEVF